MKNLLTQLFYSSLTTPFRTANASKLINSVLWSYINEKNKSNNSNGFYKLNFPLSRVFSLVFFCTLTFLFPYMVIAISKKIYCYTFESFLKIPWGYEVFWVFPRFFWIAAWIYYHKYYYITIYVSINGILFLSRYLNHSHTKINLCFRMTVFKWMSNLSL